MDTLPFDLLCLVVQAPARTWFGWQLLDLRIVCKRFLRACDSATVMRHWRHVNVDVLVWQARTRRFCPPLTFDLLSFAKLARVLAQDMKDDCAIASGALVWLHYATIESVVFALQRCGKLDKTPPLSMETLCPGEAAVPVVLLDENSHLYSEDDEGSDYLFDEDEWERDMALEVELDDGV